MVPLCSLGWTPHTCNPPVSASQVLGSQVSATTWSSEASLSDTPKTHSSDTYYFPCYDETPDKKRLKGRRIYWGLLVQRMQSLMAGMMWQQEVAGHITSTACFLLFIRCWTPAHTINCTARSYSGPSISIKII